MTATDARGAGPKGPMGTARKIRAKAAASGGDTPLAARWVSDLGADIGSPRWFRSLGLLVALVAVTFAFWPDFSALHAAAPVRLSDEERDEYRSQMITPLALGADSGRRMAPTRLVVPLANAPERPVVELTATIGKDDTLPDLLRRAGVSGMDSERVEALIGGALPAGDIKDGTAFDITLGRRTNPSQPRPLEKLSFRARFDLELTVAREGGPLALERRNILVDDTPLRITGTVGSSLYRAARAAGAPAKSVQQYLKAIGAQLDLNRQVGAGDTFDMIIDYKRAETGEVEVGDVLYAGLNRKGSARAQLLRWGKDGRFYDADGEGELREGLIKPVNAPVGSGYGMRRHPILKINRMHKGLDFRARSGLPIYAVTDGTVAMAGRNGGYGNYVKLNHGGGLGTGYAHMSRIAVRRGQHVKRGQVIGYVGSTGLSTGAHLHYELYRNGRAVNPNSVNFVVRQQLSSAELRQFRQQLVELKKVKPGAALEPLAAEKDQPVKEVREADLLSNAPE